MARVRDGKGRFVTSVRDIGTDGRWVPVWRTDSDQPPLDFTREDAERLVNHLNADPDISGYEVVEERSR